VALAVYIALQKLLIYAARFLSTFYLQAFQASLRDAKRFGQLTQR
jgi:hypothetical protein